MDTTFITRERKPTTFELKYLEKIGNSKEKRNALSLISPELQDKERETEEADQKLAETKMKFEKWRTQFQVKKKELEAQNMALMEKKKTFDKAAIVQQNEITSCKEKEKEAKKAIAQISQELTEISSPEEELRHENDALIKEISELQPDADYLQNVVLGSHAYDNPDSILNRHKTLMKGRKEYLEKYKSLIAHKGDDEAELKDELIRQKTRLIDSTMKFNAAISQVNNTRKKNTFVKTAMIKDVQRFEEKSLEVSTIKNSIRTIYARAIEMSKRPADRLRNKTDKEEEMMLYIQDRFSDLSSIIEKWNSDLHQSQN